MRVAGGPKTYHAQITSIDMITSICFCGILTEVYMPSSQMSAPIGFVEMGDSPSVAGARHLCQIMLERMDQD